MFWLVISGAALLGGALYLTREACSGSTRTLVAAAKIGGEPPPPEVLRLIATLTEQLRRNDVSPVGHRYEDLGPTYKQVTFLFYTPFRAQTAYDLLRGSHRAGSLIVRTQTAVLAEGEEVGAMVGRIDATSQETPWTCGPAALRAVLAHYGLDLTEAEASAAAVVAPAIGARPEGMTKAAETYGCRATAYTMNNLGELVDLLAQGIPPICVVDSWTRPGQVGHYVVVSRIDPTRGLVTVMDPHTEGNWRVLTAREFDARWWAKRRGAEGKPVIVKRVCVVIEPDEGMAVSLPTSLGATPDHGRTAKCEKSSYTSAMRTVFEGVAKAAVTVFSSVFTAGQGTKYLQGLVDEVANKTKGLKGDEFNAWINDAGNDEVALWAIGMCTKGVPKVLKDGPGYLQVVIKRLNLTAESFAGDLPSVIDATFKYMAVMLAAPLVLPPCKALHAVQALAGVLGGKPAIATLNAAIAKRPRGGEPFFLWIESTLAALNECHDEHATPTGAPQPETT